MTAEPTVKALPVTNTVPPATSSGLLKLPVALFSNWRVAPGFTLTSPLPPTTMRVKDRVPWLMLITPSLGRLPSTKLILLAPVLVSAKPARSTKASPGMIGRTSQRLTPPIVASAVSLNERKPACWPLTLLLTMTPAPSTPAPAITALKSRFTPHAPLWSRVAPAATVITWPLPPNAALAFALRMPPFTVMPPVKVLVPPRVKVPVPLLVRVAAPAM